MTDVPDEVRALAAERDERRRAEDFPAADALRDRILELGFSVIDGPDGPSLEPVEIDETARLRPRDVESLLDDVPTARHERPLGRRGMARRRGARARRLPLERRGPRRPVRRRGRNGHGPGRLRRGGRGPAARARDRLGRGTQRRAQAFTWSDRPGGGRIGRADGRRVRAARGRARGSERRGMRSVRHLDRRPPRVPRQRWPGGRRDRGLPDGVPSGRDPRRGAVRREVPVVPDGRHRVFVPHQGGGTAGAPGRRAGQQARTPDVPLDPARRARPALQTQLLPVPGTVPRSVRPARGTARKTPGPRRGPAG